MRSGRILVVDDEANARTALAELLRDEGFDVETAADAFKALGKYESFNPQVVVTDLKMPGMDGIELVKKIRGSEDPASVVVMTAFGAVSSAVDAMRSGAADYLTKPINFDELLVVLDKVLEQHAAVAGASSRPRRARQHHRHEPADAARVRGCRSSRTESRDRHDHGRERHG
jgi:DNA-binding NtrC family response regulator